MKYNRPKGIRPRYRGSGIMILNAIPKDADYWYSYDFKIWVTDTKKYSGDFSTHQPCKTLRRFRKLLGKMNKYLPGGTDVMFVSRFKNCNIVAKIKGDTK